MTSEQLVKHCAKSIDVCGAADGRVVSDSLFRRHVTGRAQDFQRARDRAFRFDQSGQSEIGQMRFAFSIEQNVSRLDVAMQNAVLVRVMNSARHFRNEFRRAPDRHRLAPGDFIKLAAFDELHAEVARAIALADFVNRNDAGMIQTGGGFGFAAKALQMRFGGPMSKANDFSATMRFRLFCRAR